jgi:hypothetical protein
MTAALATVDRRFVGHAILGTALSLVAFGFVSAIIPNPVFGRQIPPAPFAITVWLLSAPLMGLVAATYTSPAPVSAADAVELVVPDATTETSRGATIGTLAGIGAFLAIGCPVCNKIALLLLGTSGALTVFAPLQPVIGAVSLGLLIATLAWRLRARARGGACVVRIEDRPSR